MPGERRSSDCGTEDAAGFVLAGGQSSRMGRDKALLSFAGQPLIVRALSILRGAGLMAAIAGAQADLAGYAPVIHDAGPSCDETRRGPLGGICAALAACPARYAVFLPVDLPLLPASLIGALLRHARIAGRAVTVPSANGFAQTFPAILDHAALPALEAELAAGRGGCFAAFQAAAKGLAQPVSVVPVELLVQAGQAAHPEGLPAARWFLNLNTPADLEFALRQIPARIA